MIKIVEGKPQEEQERIVLMAGMKPLQFGRIISNDYRNHVVMRTASINHFEVMDLSNPGADECWTGANIESIYVELSKPGEKIALEIFNEE